MAEYKGKDYLKSKLEQKRTRVKLRYKHYEMKYIAKDLRISTPPALRGWMGVLGWCAKSVDSLADRLIFNEFENDTFNLEQIYNANNRDILIDSSILGALISACSFIYITADEDGFPMMRVIDGMHATGIIDPVTNMLKEGYAVLEFDENDLPLLEAYFTPGVTVITDQAGNETSVPNVAPYPLLVPMIYRPDAVRPFGHSRISRACMDIVGSAVRTIKRSEISAEFYSYPQKYVLGMNEDAEEMESWKATMSAMLRIDRDEDGNVPIVGAFAQQSMTPHTDQLRMLAGLFAGETGLTLDDLGFPSVNPSSAEAIRASHETLRLTARKAQINFGIGLLNAGYLAACIRDDQAYLRRQLYSTIPKWRPIFEPDTATLSGIGDAVQKIQQSFPDYFTEDRLKDLTGI